MMYALTALIAGVLRILSDSSLIRRVNSLILFVCLVLRGTLDLGFESLPPSQSLCHFSSDTASLGPCLSETAPPRTLS